MDRLFHRSTRPSLLSRFPLLLELDLHVVSASSSQILSEDNSSQADITRWTSRSSDTSTLIITISSPIPTELSPMGAAISFLSSLFTLKRDVRECSHSLLVSRRPLYLLSSSFCSPGILMVGLDASGKTTILFVLLLPFFPYHPLVYSLIIPPLSIQVQAEARRGSHHSSNHRFVSLVLPLVVVLPALFDASVSRHQI